MVAGVVYAARKKIASAAVAVYDIGKSLIRKAGKALADNGYVVFRLDNRGASNRGTAFENTLYRAMGTIEVEDQAVGARYLKSLPYVDGDRIGVFTLATTLSGLALAISSVGLPRIMVREITRNPAAAGDLLRKSAWLRWAGSLLVLGALAGYGAVAGWRLDASSTGRAELAGVEVVAAVAGDRNLEEPDCARKYYKWEAQSFVLLRAVRLP